MTSRKRPSGKTERVVTFVTQHWLKGCIVSTWPKELTQEVLRFYYKTYESKWSAKHKSNHITILNDETITTTDGYVSIRLEDFIPKKQVSVIEFTIKVRASNYESGSSIGGGHFFGVISSLHERDKNDFHKIYNDIPFNRNGQFKYAVGIDDNDGFGYIIPNSSRSEITGWDRDRVYNDQTVQMICDFTDIKNKVLRFKIDDEPVTRTYQNKKVWYEFTLPNKDENNELKHEYWYPCVGLYWDKTTVEVSFLDALEVELDTEDF